jgi:peptidoglycan/xylan/chitin deacetylase (PgdA/CDA1 family)
MIYAFITVDLENLHTPLRIGKYDHNLIKPDILSPMLNIFDRHEVKAVFFASVFEYCRFDKQSMVDALGLIDSKGHDIQLHAHPYWCYGRENMWQYSLEEQIDIIGHGKELIRDWIGKYPIAHRAGAYGVNKDTLKALSKNGIPIDSSMYFQHPNCKIHWSKNRITEKDGIVEIPVTGFQRKNHVRIGPFRLKTRERFVKTDINAATRSELRSFLHQAKKNDIRMVNIFMHSYSLLNHDDTFSWFTSDGPGKIVLENLLQDMTGDDEIMFLTMTQFWDQYQKTPDRFMGSDHVPVSFQNIHPLKRLRKALH